MTYGLFKNFRSSIKNTSIGLKAVLAVFSERLIAYLTAAIPYDLFLPKDGIIDPYYVRNACYHSILVMTVVTIIPSLFSSKLKSK